jgi:hypothetical protein
MTSTHPIQTWESDPETEVINSLSLAIQRQSATCKDLVTEAVALEREQCAAVAEEEAKILVAESDHSGSRAALRIAQRIRQGLTKTHRP